MALALYRRYRPDTFDGIIGQNQVTVPLSRALDEGKLTHAYLFSGPRGCGKTSSARILARCINCAKGPTSHPCGVCDSCKDLETGGPGSIDVVEIDAASHNGVEDARELRERAAFAPARDRYKIFILDEAHMVTQQGFNALLKIVEEPPEHVMFIFATTEPDKVISTIRSRTHHYPFRLVSPEVMGPYLEQICDQEEIDPEPGVLKLAMRAGGGSVRDTLSVLDQLMVGAVDGEISYDSAVALLGFTPDALIGEAIDAVIDADGEKLYGVVQKVVVGGFEPRRFVEDLLSRVRDLLVLTLGGEKAEGVLNDDSAAQDMGDLHRQASALGLSTLTAMAEIINTALGGMTGATSPRMRLELLAARLLSGRENGFGLTQPTAQNGANAGRPGQAPNGGRANPSGPAAQGGGFIGSNRNAAPRGNGGMGAGANGPAANGNAAMAGADRLNGQHGQNPQNTQSGFAGAANTQASAAARQPGSRPTNAPATPQGNGPSSQTAGQSSAQNASAAASPKGAGAPAPASAAPHVDPNATPDEKWDVVLSALPEGVKEYVTRDKVPQIAFMTNAAGKSRLAMTFDCALSQHAFALALASDAAHNGEKAANVVLDTVRSVFGQQTMIAPTGVAANGEKVVSTKRMKPDELAQVKRKIALSKAGLVDGASIGSTQHGASEPKTQAKDEKGADESDDSSHRAGQPKPVEAQPRAAAANVSTAKQADDDSAAGTGANVRTDGKADAETETDSDAVTNAGGSRPEDDDDYDPWLHPLGNVEDESGEASGETKTEQALDAAAESDTHHKKYVAVPDTSDGIDPWAISTSPSADGVDNAAGNSDMANDSANSIGSAASDTGTNAKQTAGNASGMTDSGSSQGTGPQPAAPGQAISPQSAAAAGNASSNMGGAGQGKPSPDAANDNSDLRERFKRPDVESGANRPEVAAEEDEYSLNDESLGQATALGLDELKKLFEVKKVEQFAADDPHNPKNIKPASRHDNEQH
ncbi:DNA polymerase III subunit gamma and tau [Bifidobacterium sp. ESL0790]|uniref:DNA polymerase III subunit gamma and tau n=1 Tax=Bifidobacterium sp. ESL0790 TaxID=2983233 RepID=UPI0023F6AD59|nr:DNA polymerase III subunit gamma and tau [Bifidobacterium sp. ESL0790]WEV72697.1 DNA polymerase III subunit gamma and tau [Bifidobacterium sp. ESL0790]